MLTPIQYSVAAGALFAVPLLIVIWRATGDAKVFWRGIGLICVGGFVANSLIGYSSAEVIAERAETLQERIAECDGIRIEMRHIFPEGKPQQRVIYTQFGDPIPIDDYIAAAAEAHIQEVAGADDGRPFTAGR